MKDIDKETELIESIERDIKGIQVWTCKRCQHQWANRKLRRPKQCPKCKSACWDEAKE